MKPYLTIIVLAKNNYSELIATLDSIYLHCSCLSAVSILVVDGSSSPLLSDYYIESVSENVEFLYSYSPSITGIYPSMNFALTRISTPSLVFLNSGDYLISDITTSAYLLLSNCLDCVFSTSVAMYDGVKLFLNPSTNIRNLSLWFSLGQLPCHQTMVFSTMWHRNHLYPTDFTIASDSYIKRLALQARFSYFPQVTVSFSLGGISSDFSFSSLKLFLRSSDFSFIRKTVLLFRFVLVSIFSPRIVSIKNNFINFLCSF